LRIEWEKGKVRRKKINQGKREKVEGKSERLKNKD